MIIRSLLENGQPNHVAVSRLSVGITYQEIVDQVDNLTASLPNIGLRKGDRIAMALPTGLEVIASFLAASTVGTAAPLNPSYTRAELNSYVGDTGLGARVVPTEHSDHASATAT